MFSLLSLFSRSFSCLLSALQALNGSALASAYAIIAKLALGATLLLPLFPAVHAANATSTLQESHDLIAIAAALNNAPNKKQKADKNEPAPLKVCAVPQLYAALSTLQNRSTIAFTPRFATNNELYALLSNTSNKKLPHLCDVLLSADERLPISLIRMQKAVASTMQPFTRAPLILWARHPHLLKGTDPQSLIENHNIKSIVLAQSQLTPVGFATEQVLKQFDISKIKEHIYKANHEYQVYSMINSGNVDCGIVSYPLIINDKRQITGSAWLIPRNYYPDIRYYGIVLTPSSTKASALKFLQMLASDLKVQDHLQSFGFAPL